MLPNYNNPLHWMHNYPFRHEVRKMADHNGTFLDLIDPAGLATWLFVTQNNIGQMYDLLIDFMGNITWVALRASTRECLVPPSPT